MPPQSRYRTEVEVDLLDRAIQAESAARPESPDLWPRLRTCLRELPPRGRPGRGRLPGGIPAWRIWMAETAKAPLTALVVGGIVVGALAGTEALRVLRSGDTAPADDIVFTSAGVLDPPSDSIGEEYFASILEETGAGGPTP